MRFFVCVVDPVGSGVPDALRLLYETFPRARGLAFHWQAIGHGAVLTGGDDLAGEPMIVRDGDWVGVGTVRLDNRPDLERWSGCPGGDVNSLELVLRAVARRGADVVGQILGDFAFVAWNASTRVLIASCDIFRVNPLYYTQRNGRFAFASRAEALALDDAYDLQYLAERVANCMPSASRTAYAGVCAVPGGTMATIERGRITTREYWSPDAFEPGQDAAVSEREAAETCRDLLARSVRLRLSGNGDTWAQLSGGVDSSAVASTAQWLLEHGTIAHGLAGTVTWVDRQHTGADERTYSDAVANRWRLRNETIADPPVWYDSDNAPPRIDQPRTDFMFFPREYRMRAIVRAAGGRVLLTGQGPDEFLRGNMFFFADWVAHGWLRSAAREMARRAAIGRASFWELAYRNALLPLLPPTVQRRVAGDEIALPPWVRRGIARRYALHARLFEMLMYGGRIGHKYHDAVATCVVASARLMPNGVLDDALDVRHPFLYRPLVEFALRLPPEFCARPYERKWVLREAMRGIVPELVRTRVGKGTQTERYAWSLAHQRPLLEPLVRDSMLADLGIVDAGALRTAFDAASHQSARRDELHATLQGVLAIEAWLQMRAGRWPRGGHLSSSEVHDPSMCTTEHVHRPVC